MYTRLLAGSSGVLFIIKDLLVHNVAGKAVTTAAMKTQTAYTLSASGCTTRRERPTCITGITKRPLSPEPWLNGRGVHNWNPSARVGAPRGNPAP